MGATFCGGTEIGRGLRGAIRMPREAAVQARVGKGGTNGGRGMGTQADGRNVYAAVSDSVRIAGDTHESHPFGDANFDPEARWRADGACLASGESSGRPPGHSCDPRGPECSPAQPGAVSAIPVRWFPVEGRTRARLLDGYGKVLWMPIGEDLQGRETGVPARGGRSMRRSGHCRRHVPAVAGIAPVHEPALASDRGLERARLLPERRSRLEVFSVSASHSTLPSAVEKARHMSVHRAGKHAPGILAETAPGCAGLRSGPAGVARKAGANLELFAHSNG